MVGFYAAWLVAYLIVAPPGKGGYLDPGYQKHMAGVPVSLITASAYVSVLTDVYIMIIPMHQVPKLGLSYKRKWGISLIFLFGAVVRKLSPNHIRSDDNKTFIHSAAEVNFGMVCLSMPVVLALFVGRITAFGQSLGSWVNVRKAVRHGAGGSASSLSPSDGNESAPESEKPELPMGRKEDPKLVGMRKFIRNIYRSRAASNSSENHNATATTAVMSTFNDLTSADLSYHAQLKSLHPTQTVTSCLGGNTSEKRGETFR
ncbi:Extracellular membrane protein- CFEM domain protein [Apiospora kogelbergensis]|uniref:Extracellular membrane protein- CFEM domain protein n=1 Tax=Apiospora kogelbergensis TaxID=1337665 RepID=A0AAW0QGZ6_9PEZI